MTQKNYNKATWGLVAIGYVVFIFLVVMLFSKCTDDELETYEPAILTLVNDIRTKGCKCGEEQMPPVSRVSWNNLLYQAAKRHSDDMYKHKFTDHVGSDGSAFWERLSDTGFPWSSAGENIAKGFKTESEVFDAWMQSPCHCKNIMGDFQYIGVASSGDYWTMVLAKLQ